MTSWAGPVAIGLLLAAGLPRLAWGSPSQRALATGLCSSAGVLALGLDQVRQHLADLGASATGTLLQCLGVTLAAAGAFGMARQVSPTVPWSTISPTAVAVPVGVLQCLLYAVSGVQGRPGSVFLDNADRPAVVALWVLTAAGPVAAGVLLLPVLRTYGPGLARLPSRIAVDCTVAGLVVVGLAGSAMGVPLVLGAAGRPGDGRLVAAAEALAAVGLGIIAVGVLAARAATAVDPLRRWWRAQIALRRLDGLAGELVVAAPEWAVRSVPNRWSPRNPAGQLYRRVIAIRDASWTLLGPLEDEATPDRALEFARSRAARPGFPEPTDTTVSALAEACWLRYAIEVRARGVRPAESPAAQFPERVAEQPGTLDDEAAFLVAVARVWRSPLVDEFLAGVRDDSHSALRTA